MTASDREIVTTRVLAWPRERVFRAWTDPDPRNLFRLNQNIAPAV